MRATKSKLYPRQTKLWTKIELQRFSLLYPKYSNRWLARKFGRTEPAIISRAGILGLLKDVSKGYRLPLSIQRKWTDREINFLRKHCKAMTFSELADCLERTCSSVASKITNLGLKKIRLWTSKEEQQLRQLYQKHSLKELAKKFNCAKDTIFCNARRLEIPMKVHRWNKKEDKYLVKNYPLMTVKDIAKKLTRHSVGAIFARAKQLGLRSGYWWTEKEIQYLKRWYYKKTAKQLAQALGRGEATVIHHAKLLGLSKIKRWTKEEYETLIHLYSKGITQAEIARRLGRRPGSLHQKLYPPHVSKRLT